MKIGFFTESYLPQLDGVATSFVGTTVEALQKRGHEVFIVAPKYPGYKDKGKNVFRLTSIKVVKKPEIRLSIEIPEKALLDVMRTKFDIIHGFPGLAGITFAGLQIARVRKIPFVGTFHTFLDQYTHYILNGKVFSPTINKRLSVLVANRCDYLIAPTEKVKHEMLAYHIRKPIIVIPTGIDLENYKNPNKGFLRKRLNIPDDNKILLYVGRIGREKSVEFLIRSFKYIHTLDAKTVLVLVGDGPDKDVLKRLSQDLQIEKNVYFAGLIDHSEMKHVYADADLFVFASQTETQGMVVLEALASGVPVIAVEDEVFDKILEDGKNSYLTPKNTERFAKKTIELLEDKVLYKHFSHQALLTAQKYSIEKTAEVLERFYEEVIANKKLLSERTTYKLWNNVRKLAFRS